MTEDKILPFKRQPEDALLTVSMTFDLLYPDDAVALGRVNLFYRGRKINTQHIAVELPQT